MLYILNYEIIKNRETISNDIKTTTVYYVSVSWFCKTDFIL